MVQELTYQERLNRFEIAQETIGFMMAMRTRSIAQEEKKNKPDASLIEGWRIEFSGFSDELHNLNLKDDAKIQHVLDEYCPIVKAAYTRGLSAT